MSPLVTLTGDGTFRAPDTEAIIAHELPDDPHLAALMRLRALLGDDLEDQIATRLYLPAALGVDDTDHLLPSTLVMLAGMTGDLAPYGWRMGPGLGRAWRHAWEQQQLTVEAARIALYGYEGPLMVTVLGPATLAAASFLSTGERTLSDPGAVRDLPMLLAEGITEHLAELRDPTCWCGRTPWPVSSPGASPPRRAGGAIRRSRPRRSAICGSACSPRSGRPGLWGLRRSRSGSGPTPPS